MSTDSDPKRAEVDESGVVSPGALAEQATDTQDRAATSDTRQFRDLLREALEDALVARDDSHLDTSEGGTKGRWS